MLVGQSVAPEDFVTRKSTPYYLAGSVALLTFLVYLPALQNDFVELDDAAYVLDNPHIRSFNQDLIRWAFFKFYAANWHPLTWVSHAIDYALWGTNPLGHHLTNIILHAINSALVVVLVLKLLEVARRGISQNLSPWFLYERTLLIAAGVTGLLFGLHPLHVESVAWVSERKDLLCALFFLLSVIQYGIYLHGGSRKKSNVEARSWFVNRHFLAALGFFVLALLSKPMAVTLPCVLLLFDWFPYGRIRDIRTLRAALIEKLPFICLSLASSILTILAQKAGESMVSTQVLPWSGRTLVAARSLMTYLWKMILPLDLAPYYPYPGLHEISLYRTGYLIPAILVAAITVAAIMVVRRQKIWFAVWGYYLITLLPVLGIVQVGGQVMADRYTYLPSLGPFLLVGLAGAWIYERVKAKAGNPQLVNRVGLTAAVVAVFLLSILTVKQIGIWKNSMVVFDAILAKDSRRSPMVYFHRGVAYEKAAKAESAINDYTLAISLFPSYYEAFFARGTTYERLGRLDRALEDYNKAISLKPSSYEAYTNRGLVNKKLGRRGEAIADFARAVALSPSAAKAHLNLGIIHTEDGMFAEAIEEFSYAITIDTTDAEAYGNRGIIYAVIGRPEAALRDFNKALELRPDLAVIYYNRGRLYAASGQQELALADFEKACRLGDESSCRALRE
jgi:protein O-mannosyl-transferase